MTTRMLSCVRLFVTPWTIACQVPLSMEFPRQEYWSGLPCPPPGDLPNPGMEPASLALAGSFFSTEPSGKPTYHEYLSVKDLYFPIEVFPHKLLKICSFFFSDEFVSYN